MIDQRAIVGPGAEIGKNVSIGPFSVISGDVVIGDDTWIGPHVVINGPVAIGRRNRIYQFCSIGEAPQHMGYKGEDTKLEIGDDNTIREYCTINRGTLKGGGVTRILNNNFLMSYVHIAHDSLVGSNTVFTNCASLAGHVSVGDHAILGGFTLVHQFCRIGEHSITGIGCVCLQDVPPYVLAAGNRASPHGINVKGLQRRGFSKQQILDLKRAYKILFRSELSLRDACKRISRDLDRSEEASKLVNFLSSSERGIIR